jgi:very-short-patch-repair endonuclease
MDTNKSRNPKDKPTTAAAQLKEALRKAKQQKLTRRFLFAWRAAGGPRLMCEVVFHPTRKWRFDFADREKRVAVELEGGVWTGGAHTRGEHYESDCEKYNAAAALGWRVFRLTTRMISREHLLPIVGVLNGKVSDGL